MREFTISRKKICDLCSKINLSQVSNSDRFFISVAKIYKRFHSCFGKSFEEEENQEKKVFGQVKRKMTPDQYCQVQTLHVVTHCIVMVNVFME